MLTWTDGEPRLWYKPVVLEGESRAYEPSSRSY
jgi:hypothetical protein